VCACCGKLVLDGPVDLAGLE